jgi:uncharacterized protein (DUF1697 family)
VRAQLVQDLVHGLAFAAKRDSDETVFVRTRTELVDVTPERFAVSGREIYSWHPNGIHGSKLASLLGERRLGISATARNWNTVTKLVELADLIS